MNINTKITTCIGIASLLFIPVVAFADFGLGDTAGAAGLTGYGSSIPAILGSIIGSVLSLIGIVFFILVVYGGFMWMTAGGNQENVKKAINTVVSAAIGLVVVLAAYAITTFALGAIGGSSVSGGSRGSTTQGTGPDPSNGPGTSGPDVDCVTDTDCSDNFECLSGFCFEILDEDEDVALGDRGAACTSDSDCLSDLWCPSGTCVDFPPLVEEGGACTEGIECDLGLDCYDGICSPLR